MHRTDYPTGALVATQGRFITFEGIDGCGKTTQLRLLARYLQEQGHHVETTVEPGGTEIGRLIRKILLDAGSSSLVPRAELLLYFASRAQNVEEVIRPALARGAIVLCDRFTDSTVAYQGFGRGLATETILTLDAIACGGLVPDRTVLIDIDVPTSQARAQGRNEKSVNNETRLDDESADFHQRVRYGYLALAAQHPHRFLTVDGAPNAKTVAKKIWEIVAAYV